VRPIVQKIRYTAIKTLPFAFSMRKVMILIQKLLHSLDDRKEPNHKVIVKHNRSDLRALCTAVSVGVVEQRSAQPFSQQLPIVPQLLRTQCCTPATPLQQELQLPLPSGRVKRVSQMQKEETHNAAGVIHWQRGSKTKKGNKDLFFRPLSTTF